MTPQGDTKRPRSVKLEIDPNFCATAQAGGVLVEQTLRSLSLRKLLKEHLPARSGFFGCGRVRQRALRFFTGKQGTATRPPIRNAQFVIRNWNRNSPAALAQRIVEAFGQ